MQTQIKFENFARELRTKYPGARVQLDSFPSGAQTLAFVWHECLWVFDYVPSHAAFGVQEVGEDDSFTLGYDHVFKDFENGKKKLLELVSMIRDNSLVVA